MKHELPDDIRSHLTPAQAADVIRYYDAAENERSYRNNWKRKIPLGRVAVRTSLASHSILPSGEPLLTPREAASGLDYIEQQAQSPWPVEPTDEQWEQIFELSDKRPIPVDEAYASIMGIKPRHWN